MDEPVEGSRMSSDTTPKVRATPDLLIAEFEERRLSLLVTPTKDAMAIAIRGSPTTSCGMFIDKEIATALTQWLQARIAEM
jgi:hypothetical protein